MPSIETRLTKSLGIEHPILSAPMALAAGGKLAAAVSDAGGFGLIGGGYGDAEFLKQSFRDAGNARVGCGFITWSLAEQTDLLDLVIDHAPTAVMLSFGNPAPFAAKVKSSGAKLICQCQTIAHVQAALDVGADIIVAQGGEAGGHGALRGTMNFVPEVADYLTANAPEVLLLAAGGIADGRGLAAALMLGADGVLIGTRFWASAECLAPDGHLQAAVSSGGDDTLQTSTVDIARGKDWPPDFKVRVRQNAFTDKWHGNETALTAAIQDVADRYMDAYKAGDAENSAAVCGEAIGLIHDIPTAGELVTRIAEEARALLDQNRV